MLFRSDRLNPIISGRVPVEGCDCNFFPLRPEELFPRVYNTQDFDVTELSASSHILTTLRGDAQYLAIPAFVSRVFRHGTGDLRHLEAVREPRPVVIALVIDEDLRLVGQPAESGRMQYAVAVPGVERARRARGLGHEAAPALALIHGVRRQGPVGFAATVD